MLIITIILCTLLIACAIINKQETGKFLQAIRALIGGALTFVICIGAVAVAMYCLGYLMFSMAPAPDRGLAKVVIFVQDYYLDIIFTIIFGSVLAIRTLIWAHNNKSVSI